MLNAEKRSNVFLLKHQSNKVSSMQWIEKRNTFNLNSLFQNYLQLYYCMYTNLRLLKIYMQKNALKNTKNPNFCIYFIYLFF